MTGAAFDTVIITCSVLLEPKVLLILGLGFPFESLLPYFEKHIYCSLADIFDHKFIA
jgi:hypothetical protein